MRYESNGVPLSPPLWGDRLVSLADALAKQTGNDTKRLAFGAAGPTRVVRRAPSVITI